MPEDLHETAASRLRRNGQRYTTSRRRLIEILEATDGPLTLPAILDRGEGMAQSSAYRNLSELISAGVVNRIVTADEFAYFELAEDLTSHHHHLICTHCGLVVDFTVPDRLERSLDKALSEVADGAGFEVDHHRLDLIGTCTNCH